MELFSIGMEPATESSGRNKPNWSGSPTTSTPWSSVDHTRTSVPTDRPTPWTTSPMRTDSNRRLPTSLGPNRFRRSSLVDLNVILGLYKKYKEAVNFLKLLVSFGHGRSEWPPVDLVAADEQIGDQSVRVDLWQQVCRIWLVRLKTLCDVDRWHTFRWTLCIMILDPEWVVNNAWLYWFYKLIHCAVANLLLKGLFHETLGGFS